MAKEVPMSIHELEEMLLKQDRQDEGIEEVGLPEDKRRYPALDDLPHGDDSCALAVYAIGGATDFDGFVYENTCMGFGGPEPEDLIR